MTHVTHDGLAVRARRLGLPFRTLAWHVVVPLTVGAGIYMCFRGHGVRLLHWVDQAGLSGLVATLQVAAEPIRRQLPDWAFYALPDGCWTYAATASALALWQEPAAGTRWSCLPVFAGPVVASHLELLQYAGVLAGTADPIDVLFAWLGGITAVLALARSEVRRASASANLEVRFS